MRKRVQTLIDWDEGAETAAWGISLGAQSEDIHEWMEEGHGLVETGEHVGGEAVDKEGSWVS